MPEVLGVADPVGEGGRLEQRLGRDAAAMEARAADLVLVDERDLQAELGGPEGGGVAAGARTEHDEIEVIGRADGHWSGCLGSRRPGPADERRPAAGRWVIDAMVRVASRDAQPMARDRRDGADTRLPLTYGAADPVLQPLLVPQ